MNSRGGRCLTKIFVALLIVALATPSLFAMSLDGRTGSAGPAPPGTRTAALETPSEVRPPAPSPAWTVVPVGSDLADIETDPVRPWAYVADRPNDRILVLGIENATIFRTIPVRSEPVALAMNPSADTLYVGHAGNASVQAIDLDTLTVVRTIDTAFFVWDIVAPTDDTLVATRHADQVRDFVYVISSVDGRVIQELCWSEIFCNDFSTDSLVGLGGNRDWLYVVDSALTVPILLVSFHRDPASGTWSRVNESLNTEWGDIGGFARDVAGTPDNAYVYIASDYKTATQVDTTDFRSVRDLGGFLGSRSVVLGPGGAPVAVAGVWADFAGLYVFDPDGTTAAAVPVAAEVERIRVSMDGLRFVAIVGETSQDVAMMNATTIQALSPREYTNDRALYVSGRVVAFVPLTDFSAGIAVDGIPDTSVEFDTITGHVSAVSEALDEGRHTIDIWVDRAGAEIARLEREVWVDFTPPAFDLEPIPAVTPDPVVVVSGRVVDLKTRDAVNVSGRWVLLGPNGEFGVRVDLALGNNSIRIFTWDEAGNYNETIVVVEFRPPEVWYSDPSKHFRIRVPYRWIAVGNVSLDGQVADLLIDSMDSDANIVVVSERRNLTGGATEAGTLLQETLDNVSALPAFELLEPVSERTVDDHPAATAVITWQPSTYNVIQILVVITAAEWGIAWGIVGTMYAWDASTIGPIVNATVDTFDVEAFPSPPDDGPDAGPQGFPGVPWLIAILASVGAGVAAVAAFVLLQTRRRPPV